MNSILRKLHYSFLDYELLKNNSICIGDNSWGLAYENEMGVEYASLQACADFCRESAKFFLFASNESGKCNGKSCTCECQNECPNIRQFIGYNLYKLKGMYYDYCDFIIAYNTFTIV